jgi:hypothetical protein
VRAMAGAAACSTVPQAWQPPHRPDHLVDRHPQSAHWYSDAAEELPMARTVVAGSDTTVRARTDEHSGAGRAHKLATRRCPRLAAGGKEQC